MAVAIPEKLLLIGSSRAMSDFPMNFVDWLQSELNRHNWRQADLSRMTRISSGYISQILAREVWPC